jgi:hypothetical protein
MEIGLSLLPQDLEESTRSKKKNTGSFVGLAYQGKDIVFRFIIEYSSLRDFGPPR